MQQALLAVLGNRRALLAAALGLLALAAVPAAASATSNVRVVGGDTLRIDTSSSSVATMLKLIGPGTCCDQGSNRLILNKNQTMSALAPCQAINSSSDFRGRVTCPPTGITKAQVITGNGSDNVFFGYEVYWWTGDVRVPLSFGVPTSVWTRGGNDTVNLPNAGLLDGGSGNDTLYAYGNNAVIYGGFGDDYISAAAKPGAASLSGGPGNDRIYAVNGGVDTIQCSDNDRIDADWVDRVSIPKGASCPNLKRH